MTPDRRTTPDRFRTQRVILTHPHRYRHYRAITMGITFAILFGVPLSGLARVDLFGGVHRALGHDVDLRIGLIAVCAAIAAFYAVTFVAGTSPDPNRVNLYRVSTATWAVESNWTLDLAPFGVLDPRAVEVVGNQIYVSDGGTRTAGDPLRRAVFVFDVNDLAVQPTAAFTVAPNTGQYPLPVQFTDVSQGGPTSWAWDFGDGATSTLASPSHTYADAGTYTVSLTVSNSKGSDTSTQTDVVVVTDQNPQHELK